MTDKPMANQMLQAIEDYKELCKKSGVHALLEYHSTDIRRHFANCMARIIFQEQEVDPTREVSREEILILGHSPMYTSNVEMCYYDLKLLGRRKRYA